MKKVLSYIAPVIFLVVILAAMIGFKQDEALSPAEKQNIYMLNQQEDQQEDGANNAARDDLSDEPEEKSEGESMNTTYTVEDGDTLYQVADQFDESISEIMSWNNIDDPENLQKGEELRVK